MNMDFLHNVSENFQEHPVRFILGFTLSLTGTYCMAKVVAGIKNRNHLKRLRVARQEDRRKQLSDFTLRFPLNEEREQIIAFNFDQLVKKLQGRELSAKQVLEAYIAKAVLVNQEFNCVTQFVEKAFDWAAELDVMASVKGPLHGVPICIKEDHDIIGMDSTLGMSIYLNHPKSESAVMVKVLQDAGAIPFCKTNLPQTTMAFSSGNPIYGITLNPLNKSLSPGGSSSGTACLVKSGGALFGLGSDIGGSVRIPAHFCGLVSLRSTLGRLSGKGLTPCVDECAGFTSVSGVIASEMTTLTAVYKLLVSDAVQNKYDPLCVPLTWRSEIFEAKGPLRIGYLTSLPTFPSLGDTPDTALKAQRALESLGHTLLPFEIPNPWHIYKIGIALYGADGHQQIYQKLQHDEISSAAKKFDRSMSTTLLKKCCRIFSTKNKSKRLLEVPGITHSEVLWSYLAQQRAAKYMVLDEMRKYHLDLILMPAFPFPASKLEDTDSLPGATSYTFIRNLLDFPAGVVPFGTESGSKIAAYNDEGDIFLERAKMGAFLAKDMPIGVQIVGKPFHEEMVLRILNELENFRQQK